MKNMQGKTRLIGDYFFITIGSFVTAVGMNVFLVPYKIVPGGLSGLATVIYYVSKGILPVGATMFVLNVPLFIGAYRLIGRNFIIRTFYSSVALSLFIDFTKPVSDLFINNYLLKVGTVSTQPDLMLNSVFGGLAMGVGLGIVFRYNATTGGSDLIARIINRFIPSVTIGQALLLIDTLVVILAAIVFKSFLLALYACIAIFISSKVIDAVLEGVSFARAVFIISDESDKIAMRIMNEMDRGVTALKGTGMYTRKDKEVLLCVLSRSQIPTLKKVVYESDKNAFVILTDIREVLGEGFKTEE